MVVLARTMALQRCAVLAKVRPHAPSSQPEGYLHIVGAATICGPNALCNEAGNEGVRRERARAGEIESDEKKSSTMQLREYAVSLLLCCPKGGNGHTTCRRQGRPRS